MRDRFFSFFVKSWSYRDEAMLHNLQIIGLPLHAWDADWIVLGFAPLERVSPRSLVGTNLSFFEASAFYERVEDVPQAIQ